MLKRLSILCCEVPTGSHITAFMFYDNEEGIPLKRVVFTLEAA
jgi:hypothetical protein